MTRNVGFTEWKVRVAAGAVLIVLSVFMHWHPAVDVLLLVVGIVLLATGVLRYCPVNQLLGRGTGEER
jgi:uncharacterized membrane protein HdeD (DUF308 family)